MCWDGNSPPESGGDWSTSVIAKPGLHRIHYIQTFTGLQLAYKDQDPNSKADDLLLQAVQPAL